MAALISELYLKSLVLFIWVFVSALGQNLLSCETSSPDASGYRCSVNGSVNQCGTFAVLHLNSYYSSLSNLSFYLGLNRFVIAKANGFSAETQFLPRDQPLLIPIDCKCNGAFYQADLMKTTLKGESFFSIAESLEGLTTCKAIEDKNPGISPWNLAEKIHLQIPLRCSCPSPSPSPSPSLNLKAKLLLSYPVKEGDTISNLAIKFNTTKEAILSANNRSLVTFNPERLLPLTSVLIPLNNEPILGWLAKPSEPYLRFPATSIPIINPRKKKLKMWKIGVCIALSGVIVGASIAIAAAFLVVKLKKKKKQQGSRRERDVELQQLSSSVRATSNKKVSFEGSQDPLDGGIIEALTPRKVLVETYTIEELRRATEDFSSSNHIEGSVYHGRLNGKNLAVKRTRAETIAKIEFGFFNDATHHHPNIIRLLGTCLTEGNPDGFLVFEYAKNGSLKDWLHGGLAMKNQFIASCYCFLTWNQRLMICLDVALALQYMHQIIRPSYVHRNLKSRNIFLDEDFNAKIGNFGMARCIEDVTESSEFSFTNPANWSLGYLAPEYLHQGIISPSVDIFAYGVVLLEVLSGQTPTSRPDSKKEGGNVWLSERINSILLSENTDELREWMDNALGENYSFDTAVTLANLARACIDENPVLRPNAAEIVEKLSRLMEESAEGEHMLICESSCKPLVKAAASSL